MACTSLLLVPPWLSEEPLCAAAGHDEDDDKKAKGSPTQRMLAMAVDMLQAVQDLTVPNGGSVRVRIGMHVGPAYAGWVPGVC